MSVEDSVFLRQSGSTAGADANPPPGCVRRTVSMNITSCSMFGGMSYSGKRLCLAVCLSGYERRTLRTPPLFLGSVGGKMDISFSFHYMHHLKGRPDLLHIMLQKRRKNVRRIKTFALARVSLHHILQCPFNGYVNLMAKKGNDIVARAAIDLESVPFRGDENDVYESRFYNGSSSDDSTSSDEAEKHGVEMVLEEEKGKGKFFKFRQFFAGSKRKKIISDDVSPPQVMGTDFVERSAFSDEGDEHEYETEVGEEHMMEDGFVLSNKIAFERVLNTLFDSDEPLEFVLLVNGMTRRGRLAKDWALSSAKLKDYTLATQRSSQIDTTINKLLTHLRRLKEESDESTIPLLHILIAGTDSYVNDVVRAVVVLGSMIIRDRDFEGVRFCCIPIGREKECTIAGHLGLLSEKYGNVYLRNKRWKELFEKKKEEKWDMKDGAFFEESVLLKFLHSPSHVVGLPVGDVFLTLADGTQTSLPFIRYVTVYSSTKKDVTPEVEKCVADEEEYIEVKLDFWVPKAGHPSESIKSSTRTSILTIHVARQGCPWEWTGVDTSSLSSTNLLFYAISSKPVSVKRDKKSPEISWNGSAVPSISTGSGGKGVTDVHVVSEKISKLICSPLSSKHRFTLLIDGTEWNGVKFVSFNPQWMSQSRTFPVQIFDE